MAKKPIHEYYYRGLDIPYYNQHNDYDANALLTVSSATLLDITRPSNTPMELNTDDLDCAFYEEELS